MRFVGPSGDPAPAAAAAPANAAPATTPPVTTTNPAPAAPNTAAPPAPTAPGQPQTPPQSPQTPLSGPTSDGEWTVALDSTELHAGPDRGTDLLARVPQFSYLQILGYHGDWAYVYNPRARGTAFAPSGMLGPSDPPPAWVTAGPPKPTASIEAMGRAVGNPSVDFYPVDDKFASVGSLGHNLPILVHDKIPAADGTTWYRVDQGYLPAGAVRLPRAPDAYLPAAGSTPTSPSRPC